MKKIKISILAIAAAVMLYAGSTFAIAPKCDYTVTCEEIGTITLDCIMCSLTVKENYLEVRCLTYDENHQIVDNTYRCFLTVY